MPTTSPRARHARPTRPSPQRRSSRHIPSLTHHKASGQGVVRLNGQDHYCGPWGDPRTRTEYDSLIGMWVQNGRRMPEPRLTIVELVVEYQKAQEKRGLSEGELRNIRTAIRALTSLFTELPVEDFGPARLKEVRQKLADQGIVRNSIGIHLGRIRRIFEWAVSEEKIDPERGGWLLTALRTVKNFDYGTPGTKESEKVPPAPLEDIQKVQASASEKVRDLIALQLLTAMRPGELVSMNTKEILEEKSQDQKLLIYRPVKHKTRKKGKARVIPIGPQAREILEPYLTRARLHNGYLFPGAKRGRHYRVDSYAHTVLRICRRCKGTV